MPRLIASDTDEAVDLETFAEGLAQDRFDPACEESMAAMAPWLRRLANNRQFLGDILIDEVKERCAGQERGNGYGPQVVMLRQRPGWFLRANFWPAPGDAILRASGPAAFFYDLPHDHNFSFLTIGYFGPGYWSDYYEYDPATVIGVPGEKVALRFLERSQLNEGRILLYRAHRDVHRQHAPESLSVSLNIMQSLPAHDRRDQYRFDIERGEIAGLLSHRPIDALFALIPGLGGQAGLDLLDTLAWASPNDRIRFGAIAALAAAAPDLDGRVAIYEGGARSASAYVAAMCRDRVAGIVAGRAWQGHARSIMEEPPRALAG